MLDMNTRLSDGRSHGRETTASPPQADPCFNRITRSVAGTVRLLLASALPLIIAVQAPAAQPPTLTVNAATEITSSSATVTGTINPNGLETGFFVRWGLTTAYNSAGPVLSLAAQSSPVAVTNWMLGLTPSTTYHYQLVGTNAAGNGYSADMTMTTSAAIPLRPTVFTGAATAVTATSATIAGTVNPNGLPTTYAFQWGATTAYGNEVPPVSVPGQSTTLAVTAGLIDLSPGTTYHYRLVATNNAGSTLGLDQTFTSLSVTSIDNHVFTYVTNNGAITIVGYSGPGGTVAIPGTITGLPVTTIGYGVFADNSSLTNVTIPDSVTTIGERAFGFSGLAGVTIPDSVTNLGASAFAGCSSLATVVIGRGVSDLGYAVFEASGLSSVIIPDSVITIGTETFALSTVTNITIPSSVTSIGYSAFYQCTRLTGVTIPDSVTNIGAYAFKFCPNLASLTIGGNVTSLGAAAFMGTALTSVAVPDNVTNIEDGPLTIGGSFGLFADCTGLTNVVVGRGLAYLGVGAFTRCQSLVGVFFQGDAPTPGQDMFGQDIFHYTDSAIVYYLPNTAGWGPTYAGRPTALWNPQVQPADANFGMREERFGFNITGTAGIPLVIEACTNPPTGSWMPVQTCTLTNGLLYFSDPEETNKYPVRFYRIRSP